MEVTTAPANTVPATSTATANSTSSSSSATVAAGSSTSSVISVEVSTAKTTEWIDDNILNFIKRGFCVGAGWDKEKQMITQIFVSCSMICPNTAQLSADKAGRMWLTMSCRFELISALSIIGLKQYLMNHECVKKLSVTAIRLNCVTHTSSLTSTAASQTSSAVSTSSSSTAAVMEASCLAKIESERLQLVEKGVRFNIDWDNEKQIFAQIIVGLVTAGYHIAYRFELDDSGIVWFGFVFESKAPSPMTWKEVIWNLDVEGLKERIGKYQVRQADFAIALVAKSLTRPITAPAPVANIVPASISKK